MRGAGITTAGWGMRGPRGPVFHDINFEAPPGTLVALEGPSGSGRTCLLLSLTGRMRATEGSAEVAGHPLPRKMAAVRRVAALGPVPQVNDLDAALTVTELLRERSLLRRYFSGWRLERASDRRARVNRSLQLAGLSLDALPKGPRTTVRNLDRLEELRLGVALALLDEPKVLAVDDVDLKLSDAERDAVWSLLRSLCDDGLTVLAACSQAPQDVLVVNTRPSAPSPPGDPETSEDQPDPPAALLASHDVAVENEPPGGEDSSHACDADTVPGELDCEADLKDADSTNTPKEGPSDALAEAGRA